MILNFAESGHPVFRATSALDRGELKSKGRGKKSIHFNGGEETIELILNQLSIYGAVPIFCKELAKRLSRCRETRHEWEFWINGNTDRISYC